jgi:Phage tail tube protein, TTP
MSVQIPNGAIFAIASGYGTAVTITALTNAANAVATATNTFAVGDFIEVTSGWSRLTNKVVRLSAASGTNFTMEGVDTTNTTIYPAGAGTGTARKVTGYTQVAQVLTTATSGGEQQFLIYQFLESDAQKQLPTFKTPQTLTLSIADDATQPGFILMGVANDDRLQRAIKVTLPSGSILSYNGYVSLNRTPSLTVNELMACQGTISLLAEAVRY